MDHLRTVALPSLVGALVWAILAAPAAADEPPSVAVHLSQAVAFRTVSHQDPSDFDSSAFAAFREWLRSTYPRVFAELEVEAVSLHSLLIRWPGSQASLAPILFEGHYDVVPIEPGTLQDWTHPPFSGAIADGVLWGRGAVDDKAAVVAIFEAAESLLEEGFAPERTLYFGIGHDEEIGGREGAGKIASLLAQRGVSFEYMIGEGGGVVASHPLLPDRRLALIGLAEKTYVTIRLRAMGEGGHSSMPPRDSAIVRIAHAVAKLHENPFDAKLISPVSDMFVALAPHVGGMIGFAFDNQWLSAPLLVSQLEGDPAASSMVRTTTGVTMIEAGVKENVVPQHAEATVNFRLLPGDTPETLEHDVKELIDDDRIELDLDVWGPIAPVADQAGEGYRRIRASLEAVFPEAAIAPGLVTATTDTRYYAALTENAYRARPYTLDLAEPVGIHGTDERIATSSLVEAQAFYRDLLQRVAAP